MKGALLQLCGLCCAVGSSRAGAAGRCHKPSWAGWPCCERATGRREEGPEQGLKPLGCRKWGWGESDPFLLPVFQDSVEKEANGNSQNPRGPLVHPPPGAKSAIFSSPQTNDWPVFLWGPPEMDPSPHGLLSFPDKIIQDRHPSLVGGEHSHRGLPSATTENDDRPSPRRVLWVGRGQSCPVSPRADPLCLSLWLSPSQPPFCIVRPGLDTQLQGGSDQGSRDWDCPFPWPGCR